MAIAQPLYQWDFTMLVIAHLSDIHFVEKVNFDDCYVDALYKAIKSELSDEDLLIFACTGDIAASGKRVEYEEAILFFTDLLSRFEKQPKIYFCPGNHDNCFESDTTVRTSVIKDLYNIASPSKAHLKVCLEVQNNYRKFIKYITDNDLCDTELVTKHKIEYSSKTVEITLINSSYCCELYSKQGDIIFPANILSSDNTNNDLNIALIHHNLNWFSSVGHIEARRALNTYDVILFGHEHEPDNYAFEATENVKTICIEGGELQEPPNISYFNIIKIDLERNNLFTIKYTFDAKTKIFRSDDPTKKKLRDTWARGKYTSLKEDFIKFLDDISIPLSHPRSDIIKLKDIYVEPYLKIINKNSNKDKDGIFTTKLSDTNLGRIFIYGEYKSGKTSLLKYIFQTNFFQGLIPVYIDCDDYSTFKLSDIENLLENCYKNEYIDADIDLLKQNSKEKVIPILDNIDQIKLNNTVKFKILEYLIERYDNFVVASSTMFFIDDILESSNKRILEQINFYEICPLGYKQRSTLIKKWLYINGINLNQNDDQLHYYDSCKQILENIISFNNVPPFPIYLLMALSSINFGFDLSSSTYSHYYEIIITIALTGGTLLDSEIETKFTFLSELSYFLFKQNSIYLNDTMISEFLSYYNHKYDVNFNTKYLDRFIMSRILKQKGNFVYFNYNYLLYYFIARYMRDNMAKDSSILQKIDILIKKLYLKSSHSILMILLSLTKDQQVLNKLINYARSLFLKIKPLSLIPDTNFFNELPHNNYNSVDLPLSTPQEARDNVDQYWDNLSPAVTDDYLPASNYIIEENDPVEEYIGELQASIRCIAILGQIVKSHAGSLDACQKSLLIEEGFLLPLRALNHIFSKISNEFSPFIQEKYKSLNEDLMSKLLHYYEEFFSISSFIAYCFFSLPVISISTRELKISLDKFFKNASPKDSMAFFDFSVELYMEKKINIDKLKKLAKSLSTNILGFTILKYLIRNHIQFFNISHADRATILSIFKIPIHKQLLLKQETSNK